VPASIAQPDIVNGCASVAPGWFGTSSAMCGSAGATVTETDCD